MKIHEQLANIVKEKNLTLRQLHRKLVALFDNKAIAYLTLYRSVRGITEVRENTLLQISLALNISPETIKSGTDRARPDSHYYYSEGAWLEIQANNLPFLPATLIMTGKSQTPLQQDPLAPTPFYKWLQVIKGTLLISISEGNKTIEHTVAKGENLWWDSSKQHRFINPGKRIAKAILIQYPKQL